MTEEEAKTKWCPHVRHGESHVSPGTNRAGTGEQVPIWAMCLGSACMAWRWEHPGFDHDLVGNPIEPVPPEGYCGLSGATSRTREWSALGQAFAGLAGAPQ